MKKILLGLFLCLGMVFVVFSCKKDMTSTDTLIVVQQNTNAGFRNSVTRAELVGMHLNDVLPLYRSLSPSEKYAIWMDKFDFLLEEEDFSEDEKNHIQSLKNELEQETSEFFEQTADKTSLLGFIDQWTLDAISELGWEEQDAVLLTSTLFTPTDYNDILARIGGATPAPQPPSTSCDCLYSFLGCTLYTVGEKNTCSTKGCEESTNAGGCGALLSQDCKGICKASN